MNQIIQENLRPNKKNFLKHYKKNNIEKCKTNQKEKINVEFSNKIAEIPYGGNFIISMPLNKNTKLQTLKDYLKKKKYLLQFIFSSITAIIFLVFFFWKLYQNQQQEKIAKELLNKYQLTTLYSASGEYKTNKINSNTTSGSPFVIGMIKIDKIDLNYPILSESNDDLLKISLCRFTGPFPNEIGNLCIAGHNYVNNRFFSRLDELEIGDLIEIYDLYGQRQEYHIFQKYEVDATNLSCTTQDVGSNKIVTLLTCDNSNSNKRLVIQAK